MACDNFGETNHSPLTSIGLALSRRLLDRGVTFPLAVLLAYPRRPISNRGSAAARGAVLPKVVQSLGRPLIPGYGILSIKKHVIAIIASYNCGIERL